MDFNDTPKEAEFRTEARTWLDANAEWLSPGQLRDAGGDSQRARDWMHRKADAGWACITWPKEFGGRGATTMQNVIWGQEESKYNVPPNIFIVGQAMLGPTLMAHGTDTQQKRYLRPLLRADEIWCQLFSEPAAGSDLAGLRMTAVPDGEEWVLNGQKIWTSGAQGSDWGMILTRTDPEAKKHAGITYFIVDMHAPGVEVRPIKQMDGGASFNEVFFSDVRVPDANRVGAVNDGWRCGMTTLMNERASLDGRAFSSARIEDVLRLARETHWGKGAALDDAWIRQRLADFYIKLKGLEYTRYRSITAISRGQIPGPEGSIGKMIGAPLLQELAALAIDLQGAAGVTQDKTYTPFDAVFQRAYVAAPGTRLAGGTDEIMRNIVAERVLGLPGEIRLDKGVSFSEIQTGPKGA